MTGRKRSAIWSTEALADLDAIWDYYARVAGRDTANKFVRDIASTIAVIEAHPLAGRTRAELRPGLHSIAATPHVIFYRVANHIPEIVRVLDGRQDIDEIFTDSTPA